MKQIPRHLHDLFKIRLTEMGRSVLMNVGSTMPWVTVPQRGLQHHPMSHSTIPGGAAPSCGLQHHLVGYNTIL